MHDLERSLHSELIERYLNLFMSYHKGKRSQLLFTSRETTTIERSLFPCEEMWLVERNARNTSIVHPLGLL